MQYKFGMNSHRINSIGNGYSKERIVYPWIIRSWERMVLGTNSPVSIVILLHHHKKVSCFDFLRFYFKS